jgi:2-oxoglutarate dehydrogenase E1 component
MKNLTETTFLFGSNSIFIEELYLKYLQDENSVDVSWKEIFDNLPKEKELAEKNHQGAPWYPRVTKVIGVVDKEVKPVEKALINNDEILALKASMLIEAYRNKGHLLANIDPLNLEKQKNADQLNLRPSNFGFSEEDFHKKIKIKDIVGVDSANLNELLSYLQNTYSLNTGVEFAHVESQEQQKWLYEQFEKSSNNAEISKYTKQKILQDLMEVENFENFLHVKFPGAKRFSVEGGASSIASLETIIEESASVGVEEIIIGMAHRGRLNVLTKVVGKSYVAMLSEFQGNSSFPSEIKISGDVKYHMGYESDRVFAGKKIHVALAPNPSHLEAVNPVVMGRVRSSQDVRGDLDRSKVMAILIHGDAAFAGQGIVAESLSFEDLDGYKIGGTIHIVINNQVGFTTNPNKSRSGRYPTNFAKIIGAPIFHINGDDPEAVRRATIIALEYRNKFKKDIILDVVCYRLYGHNEGDEPMFTQPIMYKNISNHKTTSDIYAEKIIAQNQITKDEYDKMVADFRKKLDEALDQTQSYLPPKITGFKEDSLTSTGLLEGVITSIATNKLKEIGNSLTTYPSDFNLNTKILRQLELKKKIFETGQGVDWAAAEGLAFGSLLKEGCNIRISGQDVSRGTFSHRHAVFVDQLTEKNYIALNNIDGIKAKYESVDSNLSEYGVLGYEYGYSQGKKKCLTIWEGQFGDFANGAQIIIDQFISSSENKWLSTSNLVMLLPHGFEGQGPEHSSARLERFLQLCAQNNMRVANCSTPASYFHILRRQILSKYAKPLIIMSPKSLLRHKLAISNLSELSSQASFMPVLPEVSTLVKDDQVKKLVICSGKLYYDLYEEREKNNIKDVAIVRMEQFYPFPNSDLSKQISKYKNAKIVWAQEEPKNMGAWFFVSPKIEQALATLNHQFKQVTYIGREESASPAVGYLKIHNQEQSDLVKKTILE